MARSIDALFWRDGSVTELSVADIYPFGRRCRHHRHLPGGKATQIGMTLVLQFNVVIAPRGLSIVCGAIAADRAAETTAQLWRRLVWRRLAAQGFFRGMHDRGEPFPIGDGREMDAVHG
jgi:hypothetical protein